MLLQEIRGEQTHLCRSATAKRSPRPRRVCKHGDARVEAYDKLGGNVDVDLTPRLDMAGMIQALCERDIRARTSPGQIDCCGRKCLDQHVIAGIQHPVERNALLLAMGPEVLKDRDTPR
jgi:hypothetical protein